MSRRSPSRAPRLTLSPTAVFDNVDLEETEGLATGGVALQDSDKAGVPEDWTLSSDILGDSFVGGIVKMNADGNGQRSGEEPLPE